MSRPSERQIAPKKAAAAPNGAPAVSLDMAERLEMVLALLIDHHESMLAHAREHRAAISRANTAEIARCVAQQHADAERFAELESVRADLFGAMTPVAPVARGAARAAQSPPATLSLILSRVAERHRVRLSGLADRLRGLVIELDQQRKVLRTATESLLGHMQGLITQVARALSPTGTYSRPNTPAPSSQVVSALDLTS